VYEVMSDPGQTDSLAAEYVLGTLDADELAQAQALATTDPAFVDKVKRWERRLGELHLMVEPADPEARIWERIKSKMSLVRQLPEAQEPSAPDAAANETAPPAQTDAGVPPAEVAAPAIPAAAPPIVASPDLSPAATTAEPAAVVPPAPPAVPPAVVATPAPDVPPSLPPAPTLSPLPSSPPPIPPARPPAVEPAKPRPALAPLEQVVLRRRLGRWRAWAVLMTLLVLAAVGLLGAWKLVPEQLPPALQPTEVLRLVGLMPETPGAPVRIPAPPESQFDE
jgi:hypothetical protein